ncbi:hypothetical protein DL764_000163 [Monosporascus ibericus]|uniref:Uncharacterized protein n=1 Tax=Monosporascus ibericus TaxID=155417 RepID=A0A4Q4TY10_9PEZI|nr:hypothetical protein DL764_000163 [Monosporascus ibericus]
MPSQDKIKALLGKAFKSAGASTAKVEEKKKKKEKESASQQAREATSAVVAAAATAITTTTATTATTTLFVAPAASASVCTFFPASAPASTTTASPPVATASTSADAVSTSADAVSTASIPTPAPVPTPTYRPPPDQKPPPGSVRCGRCDCRYFPAANNPLACYHHPGAVFFLHASQRGYIPSIDMVDHPYDPQAFVWTCCRGVVGQSSGCVYRRHVPVGAQGPAGRGVSPRMNFRGENPGAFGM